MRKGSGEWWREVASLSAALMFDVLNEGPPEWDPSAMMDACARAAEHLVTMNVYESESPPSSEIIARTAVELLGPGDGWAAARRAWRWAERNRP